MPGSPHTLGITVYDTDGTTAKSNVSVTIRNDNNNETLSEDTDSSGQVIFNLANFTSGWSPGDIISYYVLYSGYEASGSFTSADTGSTTKTLTLSSIPTAPSLRYFTPQEFFDTFNLSQYSSDNVDGIKPQVIVKIGQQIETRIDNMTRRRWDDNDGDYVTVTNEYHNAEGVPAVWPESVGDANISTQQLYFTDHKPIYSLTTFEVNKASPNSSSDWQELTEADNELKVKKSIGRIDIVDSSEYPAAGPGQVRITYKYGETTTPYDIKRLSILMTAKAFAKRRLQGMNINATENEGISDVVSRINVDDEEIKSIIKERADYEVRRI